MARWRWVGLFVLLTATSLPAQSSARRATNIGALLTHSAFYHQRPVIIVGELTLLDTGELRATTDGLSLSVLYKGPTPNGAAEIRGEFWDLGRMNSDDPRLTGYDLRQTFKIDPEASWPRAGAVLVLVASAVAPATAPAAPSIRNAVLYPSRYSDQRITLVGQFSGRNLLGDLADAPAQSRYDFVLRSADAALWVTNIRPRGRDFELSLDARIDTGKWIEVSGTLQQGRGLQWLNAEGGSLRLAQAPQETPEDTQIRVPAAPPPEVVFSTPTTDETDVSTSTSVRIQFSRDLDPSTFRGRVKLSYALQGSPDQADPAAPAITATPSYLPGTRVMELRLAQPLERLRTVIVELGEGILGSDKQPLAPWTLRFSTGAQ
jgi:hypothetical protein